MKRSAYGRQSRDGGEVTQSTTVEANPALDSLNNRLVSLTSQVFHAAILA